MNDRIHAALDDADRRADLSPEEVRELEQLESATRSAADILRNRRSPGVVDAVMREVSARAGAVPTRAASTGAASTSPVQSHPGTSGPGPSRTPSFGADWPASLWRPRTVTVRPIWGLLAAAAIGALILVPALRSGPSPAPSVPGQIAESASTSDVPTVYVQFRLHAPDASDVRLAGSFTGWEPLHALHRTREGVWSAMVAMEPGIHDYAFVVDGADWVADPSAPRVDDGFGGENSRLALLLENGRRES